MMKTGDIVTSNVTSDAIFLNKMMARLRTLIRELGHHKQYNSDLGHRVDELLGVMEMLQFHLCRQVVPMLSSILKENKPIKLQVRMRIVRTINKLIAQVGGFCNQCHQPLADRTTVIDKDPTHATDNECDGCGQPLEPLPLHCVNG